VEFLSWGYHAPAAAASASPRSSPSARMGTVTKASTAVRKTSGRCIQPQARPVRSVYAWQFLLTTRNLHYTVGCAQCTRKITWLALELLVLSATSSLSNLSKALNGGQAFRKTPRNSAGNRRLAANKKALSKQTEGNAIMQP